MTQRWLFIVILIFALIGILDAGYLTMEHYSNEIPPCSTSPWVDCGKVLKSQYAQVGPIPVAVLGLTFYTSLFFLVITRLSLVRQLSFREKIWEKFQSLFGVARKWELSGFLKDLQLLMTISAVLFSIYFVYLQLAVIHAICLYCMVSAVNTILLFGVTFWERFTLKFSN